MFSASLAEDKKCFLRKIIFPLNFSLKLPITKVVSSRVRRLDTLGFAPVHQVGSAEERALAKFGRNKTMGFAPASETMALASPFAQAQQTKKRGA